MPRKGSTHVGGNLNGVILTVSVFQAEGRISLVAAAAGYRDTNSPRLRASSQAATGSRPVTSLYHAG